MRNILTSTEALSLEKRLKQLEALLGSNQTPGMGVYYTDEIATIKAALRRSLRFKEFYKKGFKLIIGGNNQNTEVA